MGALFMTKRAPGNKLKSKSKKGTDIVKNLIDIEVKNSIKILVPKFPFESNFHQANDWHVDGYITPRIKKILDSNKLELIRASKLRWIRDYLIFHQDEIDDNAEDILVNENYEYLEPSDFDERIKSFEHKNFTRYFEYKDTFCIRNHTENKKCNNSFYPCRACMISEKITFPIIKPFARLVRIS